MLRPWPRVLAALPRGRALPEALWAARHRGILVLLWCHAAALTALAAARGYDAAHALPEIGIVVSATLLATWTALDRPIRAAAATFGLFTCSALLVHFSGGVTEMHFHFFVMVVVVTLYQDWFAFLVGIAFVLFHHGVVGTIAPDDVYSSAAAVANPWGWAAIHAGFVLAESVACLVAWKKSEQYAAQIAEHSARRREAMELNDHVVQGLVVAKASFELGDEAGGKRAVDATLERAKGLVSELLGQEDANASLVREEAATVRRP